jgi:hypothetical protein
MYLLCQFLKLYQFLRRQDCIDLVRGAACSALVVFQDVYLLTERWMEYFYFIQKPVELCFR